MSQRIAIAIPTVCASALLALAHPAHAAFTASGTWDANWSVTLNGGSVSNGDTGGDLDLGAGQATATVNSQHYQPGTVTSSLTGVSGASTPKLKSSLRIDLDGNLIDRGEDTPGARLLNIKSEITGDFTDNLTVSNFETSNGFLVVQIKWSGNYQRTLNSQTNGIFDYTIKGSSRLSAFANGTQQVGQLSGPFSDQESFEGTVTDNDLSPYSDTANGFQLAFTPVSGSQPSTLRIPISANALSVPFALNYLDRLELEFDVTNPDRYIEALKMFAERDFSNTIEIQLGVQDAAGNWLDDASISSAEGYTYDPVPEPAAASTLLGLLALVGFRRSR